MHKAIHRPRMEPGMSEDVAAATTLPATAAETSPDNPWPLQLLSQKLKMHIDRAPSAWVEGQVIELNRRGTNAYLTLRDIDAEISLPASVWTKVLDRQEIPLERGSRVVALIKAEFWLKTGRLNMSVKDIRPGGPRRPARQDRAAAPCPRRRRAVLPTPARNGCPCSPTGSA